MFKFLFGKNKAEVEVVKETQRETVARALGELNEVLGGMSVRSKIAVNLETGLVEIELPEQMPDEALALPAPGEKAAAEPEAEGPKPAEADATPAQTSGDTKAEKAAA
jgi:hypothetical protein